MRTDFSYLKKLLSSKLDESDDMKNNLVFRGNKIKTLEDSIDSADAYECRDYITITGRCVPESSQG